MDEKIIDNTMENRFDGVEFCVVVEELLELEAKVEEWEKRYDDITSGMMRKEIELTQELAKLEVENKLLKELVGYLENLLVCYRIGKCPTDKVLDKIHNIKQILKGK